MEIGKDAAEKSKGLFSADDWMCTKYNLLKLRLVWSKSIIPFFFQVWKCQLGQKGRGQGGHYN
jgi:hypothetical protein